MSACLFVIGMEYLERQKSPYLKIILNNQLEERGVIEGVDKWDHNKYYCDKHGGIDINVVNICSILYKRGDL